MEHDYFAIPFVLPMIWVNKGEPMQSLANVSGCLVGDSFTNKIKER